MAYVVRFSFDVEHADSFEDAARKAWQDWQTYDRPMVEVENIVTGHRDTIDLEDLIE